MKNVAVFWEDTSEVRVYTYKLNPPKKEVILVSAANEDSIQKAEDSIHMESTAATVMGTGSIFGATKIKPTFQIGDFVQLATEPSMAPSAAKIKEVMGKFDSHHVGLVVGKDKPTAPAIQPPVSAAPAPFGAPFGTAVAATPDTPPENLIIAAIHNSLICTIPANMLKFADGSDLKDVAVVADVGGLRSCNKANKSVPTAAKCPNQHELILATGVPFGMGVSGGFGGFGGGGLGGFGAVIVMCAKCQKRGLEKDSYYHSCPISSCSYHLCMTCGDKPTNSTPVTASSSSSSGGGSRRGRLSGRDPYGPFMVGDEVQLRPTYTAGMGFGGSIGALGRPSDNLVGTVTSAPPQPLGVTCNDPRSPMRGMMYYYNVYDLMLAVSAKGTHSHLTVGDRVELSEEYIKAKGDHWCLDNGKKKKKGTKSELRVGVVLFAPPVLRPKPHSPTDGSNPTISPDDSNITEAEQRLVIVKPESSMSDGKEGEGDASREFFFKSSWLERKVPGEQQFKPGDRVQLRMGYALDATQQATLAAKCLGAPSEYSYGVVRSVGRVCDGVQRNIEVVAINQFSNKPLVSLYPSHFLALACKETTLISARDLEVLTNLVKKIASRCSLTLDVDEVINSSKLQVWSILWNLCAPVIGIDEFLSAQDEWAQWQREKGWDIAQENATLDELAKREKEAELADHSLICDDPICSTTHLMGSDQTTEAASWTCNKCSFALNAVGSNRCSACQAVPKKWKCFGCSVRNDFGVTVCKVCSCSSQRSSLVKKYLHRLKEPRAEAKSDQSVVEIVRLGTPVKVMDNKK